MTTSNSKPNLSEAGSGAPPPQTAPNPSTVTMPGMYFYFGYAIIYSIMIFIEEQNLSE